PVPSTMVPLRTIMSYIDAPFSWLPAQEAARALTSAGRLPSPELTRGLGTTMSDEACTIITVNGDEVARCPSADTGRMHNQQPRLAIVHEAAVPWTEVIAQEHLDTGARRSVHEKFIEWTGQRMVVLGRYDPGMIIERHGHRSDHLIYVLDGELA